MSMLASALALLVTGVTFVSYEQVSFREALLDRLSLTGSVIADNSAAALSFNDPASAKQTLQALAADSHIVGAVIFDGRGHVFASYHRLGSPGGFSAPRVEHDTRRVDERYARLFHGIQLAGEQVGTVYIQSDLTEMQARIRRYALIMALVMTGASLCSFIVTWRLQKAISGPVLHLSGVMARVTAGHDYSVRAVPVGNDELGSLIVGFNTMLGQIQAQDHALQEGREKLEKRVEERTHELKAEAGEHRRAKEELERVHRQLMDASRQAGMAEIATNVLHNVGNVLNSVNVSAILASELAQKSKASSLGKVVELMREHAVDLGGFVQNDPRGQHLLPHLAVLSEHLRSEQAAIVQELASLRTNIEHIKDIVAMQQSYAKVAGVQEIIGVVDLVEDSLRMNTGAMDRHGVSLVRDFSSEPLVNLDKHKVLQILINLIRNAKYACEESTAVDKRIVIGVESTDDKVRITVQDNGVGIAPENLTRIFNHGLTTRATGHGFGLHGGALAARELGGTLTVSSEGQGHGARFTLELPVYLNELVDA
jgi:two-component system NtrC family sensor kinase